MLTDKKQYLCGLICFLAAACFCFWPGMKAEAAGARVAIETESATIVKGDYFYIVVTVTSAEPISGFEGYFSYDQHVMRYLTGGSVSSGNDDVFTIEDTEKTSAVTKIKYSIRFLARKTGSCVIELRDPYGVYDEDGAKMSVASDSLALRIISKKRAEKLKLLSEEKDAAGELAGEETENGELVAGEDVETEGSTPPSPEMTADATDIKKVEQASAGEEQELPQASDYVSTEKRVSGPGKAVCIFVIVLSCLGLAGIVSYMVWGSKMEYERESENDFEPESADEIDNPEQEESLEEIDRRLEEKRQWLRKGN